MKNNLSPYLEAFKVSLATLAYLLTFLLLFFY